MWVISRQVINTWCELFTYKETSLTLKSSCTQTMHILQAIWSILFSFQVLEVQESPFLFFKITYFSTKFFFVTLLLLFVLVSNLVFSVTFLFFLLQFDFIFVSFGFLFLVLQQFTVVSWTSNDLRFFLTSNINTNVSSRETLLC